MDIEVNIGLSRQVVIFAMPEDIGEEARFCDCDLSEAIVANFGIGGSQVFDGWGINKRREVLFNAHRKGWGASIMERDGLI